MQNENGSQRIYLTAKDIMELLGVSKSKAYGLIRKLNAELEAEGYIVITGKVSKKRFEERVYGMAL